MLARVAPNAGKWDVYVHIWCQSESLDVEGSNLNALQLSDRIVKFLAVLCDGQFTERKVSRLVQSGAHIEVHP